mmetsp:Transcript_6076/g.13375  ORF Transcript_6076/g.13375 Transcript_6076/m.13375 type:complete len:389 (+) Transcript_6076:64-1230(+)
MQSTKQSTFQLAGPQSSPKRGGNKLARFTKVVVILILVLFAIVGLQQSSWYQHDQLMDSATLLLLGTNLSSSLVPDPKESTSKIIRPVTVANPPTESRVATTNNIDESKKLTTNSTAAPALAIKPSGKNIFSVRARSHGFGVDISLTLFYFKAAKEKGRDGLHISWMDGGWIYARGVCPAADMSCYFKPLNYSALPAKPAKREFAKQLLVPNEETAQELAERMENQTNLPPPTPCGVIHVRHADVTLNRGWLNKSATPKYKYLELGEYVAAFKKANESIRNVVLLTDDQNVIDDVPKYNGTNSGLIFHYLERRRFRGAEGGWENHFPSGSRKEELLTLLLIQKIVSQCSLWVGTGSSFGTLMQTLMDHPPHNVQLNNQGDKPTKSPRK